MQPYSSHSFNQGDSGGPMACQRPADGRWILLGVTSNGDGCGRPGRPGVYSQVAGFLSWIEETISREKGKTIILCMLVFMTKFVLIFLRSWH